MSHALQVEPNDDGPRIAREAIRRFLEDRGLKEEAVADAELVTSELVANAVSATSSTDGVVVRAELHEGRLRIEVDDDGPGRPATRTGTERGGFGLHVVEALSERWGTDVASQHKTVWAVLSVP